MQVGGFAERCKLDPQRGMGQIPNRNRIWCILSLQYDIWWQQFYLGARLKAGATMHQHPRQTLQHRIPPKVGDPLDQTKMFSHEVTVQSKCIYVKNNRAKFHPDPTWNDGALGIFISLTVEEWSLKQLNSKMNSDVGRRSVPDLKIGSFKIFNFIFIRDLWVLS